MKKIYKQTVGITGSSGILGSHFIKKYRKKFNFKIFNKRLEKKRDIEDWIKKNKNINIFIHMGAIASINQAAKYPKKTFSVNSKASIQFLKLIKKNNLKKLKYFLFISTSHIYKPSFNPLSEISKKKPANVYGKSKLKVENYILKNKKNFNFKIGIARIFNFYSKKQKKGFFIPDIIKKISFRKREIYFKKINTFRDYIDLNDICEILYFMISKKINKPLNVGSGERINLLNIIDIIKNKLKSSTIIKFEMKKYPGLISNIRLLRKFGYKKKINNFYKIDLNKI